MNAPSIIINTSSVYYEGFDMSKLYKRYRQPAFFFWPLIL